MPPMKLILCAMNKCFLRSKFFGNIFNITFNFDFPLTKIHPKVEIPPRPNWALDAMCLPLHGPSSQCWWGRQTQNMLNKHLSSQKEMGITTTVTNFTFFWYFQVRYPTQRPFAWPTYMPVLAGAAAGLIGGGKRCKKCRQSLQKGSPAFFFGPPA